jgi:hypothetical protein
MGFPLGQVDPTRKEGHDVVMALPQMRSGYNVAPLCFTGDGPPPWRLGDGRSSATGQHRGGES